MFLDSNIKKECCGCEACANICPVNAISMEITNDGFYYPFINKEKCINCNLCRNVCPFESKYYESNNNIKIYYGWYKDKLIRTASTSGGMFPAIIKGLQEKYGQIYIFGAIYNENNEVVHYRFEKFNDAKKMMRSKYTQSRIGDSYRQVKKILEDNKIVLFTGTPCQIAALKLFLKKNYDNLFTMDFVCHGVANPMIFGDYLKYLHKKTKSKVITYSFRNKFSKNGKHSLKHVKIEYENGKLDFSDKDLFMIAYQQRIIHRRACFNCKYANKERVSDFTVGDFWHIEDNIIELRNERMHGISMLLTNTDKGNKIINEIKKYALLKETKIEYALIGQMVSPTPYSKGNDELLKIYNKNSIVFSIRKVLGVKYYIKIVYIKLKKLMIMLRDRICSNGKK